MPSRTRPRRGTAERVSAAVGVVFQVSAMKAQMVRNMAPASTSARPISRRPNISQDQAALKTRFAAHTVNAAPQPSACQTSQPATAIMAYRIVHAGANSQSGGVQDGLFRVLYHSPGMKSAPLKAATVTAARNANNESQFSIVRPACCAARRRSIVAWWWATPEV